MKMSVNPLVIVSVAALALASCESDRRGVPTRVVCHSGGIVVLDDYATDGAGLYDGAIKYNSETTGSVVRAAGECIAFKQAKPEGWRAMMPPQGAPR